MSHDAFLRAILDRPDDDTPRLVFADWLDDHGQPDRAEFIRVQCELARLPDYDPRRPPLEDREHELLSEHEPEWLGVDSTDLPEWTFGRGFVADITANCWVAPDRLFDRHPVENWSLVADEFADFDAPEHLLQVPHFRRVRTLSLSGWHLTVSDYRALFASESLASLRTADFAHVRGIGLLPSLLAESPLTPRLTALAFGGRSGRNFYWGDAANETLDVDAFNRALAGTRLERLTAFDCGLTGDGLRRLLAAPWAAHLTHLDVSHNHIAPDAHRAFRDAHPTLRLRRLDISHTPLVGISLERVLDTAALDALTELEINGCGSARWNMEVLAASGFWTRAAELHAHGGTIPADTLEPLCRAAGPPALRRLELGNNYLRTAGVAMLCDAPWSGSLTYLGLSGNYLDDESVRVLAASGRFQHLRTLHLSENNIGLDRSDGEEITDRGAAALADAPELAALRVLNLSFTAVTDRSVDRLLNAPHWRLSGLAVAGCDLSPAAVERMAESPRLARLNLLNLSRNVRLSGPALRPLAESPHLSRLCDLDVSGIYVDDATRAALRERLGPRLSE